MITVERRNNGLGYSEYPWLLRAAMYGPMYVFKMAYFAVKLNHLELRYGIDDDDDMKCNEMLGMRQILVDLLRQKPAHLEWKHNYNGLREVARKCLLLRNYCANGDKIMNPSRRQLCSQRSDTNDQRFIANCKDACGKVKNQGARLILFIPFWQFRLKLPQLCIKLNSSDRNLFITEFVDGRR